MKLIEVVNDYITLQRSLGMRFNSSGRLLRQFSREMGDVCIDAVQPTAVAAFLRGRGALSATWLQKYRVASGLFRFAIGRGYVAHSPLPNSRPRLPPPQTPYVFSTDELRRLVAATSVLQVNTSRLQAPTFRVLILILYGAGLRISEALALTLRDVDLAERILTVRDTKFYKTRLVPIGPQLATELSRYICRRGQLAMPMGEDSALLCTRTGHALTYPYVITLFQRLRCAADIECPPGELRPPRLHDLRHTAAVHRVLAWYRDGKDVQRLLPHLATYMGHVNIASTQRYLQMTPELLDEAGLRFARYARTGDDHE